MARRVLDVFLSSTAKDLASHRMAVHERLTRTGLFHCIWQEDFGPQNAGAVEFCCRKAQKADLFVGLVGLRRGWEPDGDNAKRSITEMEHDWAKEAGRRRFLWVAPDDFPVPGNLREGDEQHGRQMAFRGRVMGAGERIASQKGFGSPELLASEIVEHLLAQLVTSDLITQLRPELARQDDAVSEAQAPAIAAAVEKLASDEDVDLLALARDPKGVDVAELEGKLRARAEEHESAGERERKASAEYWRHLGALAFLHDTKKALVAYEKAVALDAEEPEGWRYLGELQHRFGDLTTAERSFRKVLALGLALKDLRAQSMGQLRLGWIASIEGDLTAAEKHATEARRVSDHAQWPEGAAHAYDNLGTIHRTRGELAKAEEMQLKALKLYEELGGKEGMARAYTNLGLIHQTRGDLARAEEMHLKALKLNDELGRKEGMARTYSNLGVIHQTRGDLARAEEMHLKALKLNDELGRKEGVARTYTNLGLIHQIRGDLDRAEEMHLKALKLNEELGRKEGMANSMETLGSFTRRAAISPRPK